ncbi:MAG TPA: TIGR03435 family protein [Acidobacteriota bacterium]|nr:TIGR03435 family protein [Acidobacteriota bacterium]
MTETPLQPSPLPEVSGPNLFTAPQEQLGLKIVPKKITIEIFVIDHIEKTPTEN